ncbi:hypothetical protein GCM10009610_30400 [Pseudonocardia xinjiangensis]
MRLLDPVDVPRDRLPHPELADHEPSHRDRRNDTLRWSGRVLAALHDVHGLSWPAIARLTDIPQSTAHRRAQPYLATEDQEGT